LPRANGCYAPTHTIKQPRMGPPGMRQPVRALIANGTLKGRIPIAVFCLLASPAPRPQPR